MATAALGHTMPLTVQQLRFSVSHATYILCASALAALGQTSESAFILL